MKKYAYITFLDNDEYILGTISLMLSLRHNNARYPLVAMVTEKVSKDNILLLNKLEVQTIEIKAYRNVPEKVKKLNKDFNMPQWNNTFSKLYVFGAVQFDKVIYMDSDMIVLNNIDTLFERPHMSAVCAGKKYHPDWLELSSGLMVIEPKSGLDEKLIASIPKDSNKAIGDQDVIIKYYNDWKEKKS